MLGGMRDASLVGVMDPSELSQFITILVVAFGALVAAPTLVYLFEGRRPTVRERPRRRIPTRPALQPT